MKDKLFLNFHLFDGEGGEGAGETASSSESKPDVKKIQYGKASEGEGQTPGQVGSDNGAQARDLSAEFAEMISKGGEYHDIYGQYVSQAIQQRFKNQADLQGQVDQMNQGLAPLYMNYGISPGDFEGLTEAIANDDSFYQAGAEKAGMEVDQFKELMKYKADSERLSQINEEYKQEQQKQEMFRQWESEATELQKAFPNFDLGLEVESNEEFARLLGSGVDVRRAFLTSHMDEILSGANTQAQKAATQNVINNIHRSSSRPAEGALNHAPAVVRRSDPSSLSNEDLDEINRRVAMGESISF